MAICLLQWGHAPRQDLLYLLVYYGSTIMISLNSAVQVVVQLVVAGCVFWLLWWLVNYINPPQPFLKIANVILAVLAVLVLIGLLVSFSGGGPLFRA